jgi:AcrR family transcriptional regulator
MTEYSGRGDPARSMALLWRTREASSRKSEPDLSVDRIVRAAIDLADAEGLGAVSMRRVAERLGVGTMSLYTYVPGKGELLDVMLDTVYGETTQPEEGTGDWRGNLELIARENWALHLRHPWMLQVVTNRAVLGPNVIAKYDDELSAIAGVGLTDIEMDATLSLVLGYVRGAARDAVEAAQLERQTGMSDEQWWSVHAPLLAQVLDPTRYPTGARVGSAVGEVYGAAFDPHQLFEFGLERVLDGIATFIAARSVQREAQTAVESPLPRGVDR